MIISFCQSIVDEVEQRGAKALESSTATIAASSTTVTATTTATTTTTTAATISTGINQSWLRISRSSRFSSRLERTRVEQEQQLVVSLSSGTT